MLKRMRVKRLAAVVMLAVMILLFPVEQVAYAEETAGTYSESVPYMQGIKVELQRNDSNLVGWISGQLNRQRSIRFIEFEFDRLGAVDYTDYELVFDFELKSLLEDGTITVHEYSYVNEVTDDNSPGFLDNLLISVSLKDDYLVQTFSYRHIIGNSPDFQQAASDSALATNLGKNAYNTVISKADCYLREKSTGNYGLISRFIFTWDADFWTQTNTGIIYKLVVPNTGESLDTVEIQNSVFAGELSSAGTTWFQNTNALLSRFGEFVVSLPSILYAVASGVFGIYSELVLLCKTVFPFIPGLLFDVLGVVILLSVMLGVWYFIRGD